MWSMHIIAMLLSNELRCVGVVYCPFQYGIISLFCMPRMKKPPDPNWRSELTLVEGKIDLNNMPCSKHFSYRKMKRLKTKEVETCEAMFNCELEINNADEKAKRKALEEEDTHHVSNVNDALGTNPVIMLERKRSAWAEFKTYAWIVGASTKLTDRQFRK